MKDILCHAAATRGVDPVFIDLAEALSQSMAKSPFPLLLSFSEENSHRASLWVHWTHPITGQSRKGEISVYLQLDGKIDATFFSKDLPTSLSRTCVGGVEELSRVMTSRITQSIAKVALRDASALPFSLLADLWKVCCVGEKGLVGFHTEGDSTIVVFEGGAALRLSAKSDGILATQYPGGVELPVTFTPYEIVGLIERFRCENKG